MIYIYIYSINVDFECCSFETDEDKTIKGYYSKVKENECQGGVMEVVCDDDIAWSSILKAYELVPRDSQSVIIGRLSMLNTCLLWSPSDSINSSAEWFITSILQTQQDGEPHSALHPFNTYVYKIIATITYRF